MKIYTCIVLLGCVVYALAMPAAAPEYVPAEALHLPDAGGEVLEPQESHYGGWGGHHHGWGGHHGHYGGGHHGGYGGHYGHYGGGYHGGYGRGYHGGWGGGGWGGGWGYGR